MMFNSSKYLFIVIFYVMILISCSEEDTALHRPKIIHKDKLKKQFEYANQRLVQKEIDEMDYFEKTHLMPFIKTKFGVRYYVYDSIRGKNRIGIQDGDEVTMNYTISLLDGTVCYTDEGKAKTFIVGAEQIESGIHKVMPYLHYGDKAYILIPSVLAHGLLGDLSRIPPQSPILYKVEIHPKKLQP